MINFRITSCWRQWKLRPAYASPALPRALNCGATGISSMPCLGGLRLAVLPQIGGGASVNPPALPSGRRSVAPTPLVEPCGEFYVKMQYFSVVDFLLTGYSLIISASLPISKV